jgi:quercetin dioxygenase-like cupin family protein
MRLDRFAAICTLAIACIMVTAAAAQTAPPAPVNIVLQSFPITVAAGDYELISQVLDLPVGAGVPNHSHGGPVVVTVIAGEVTLMEAAGERVVKTGESWTEKVGYVHAVANKGTTTARVVASYLIPKGAARTTPVK